MKRKKPKPTESDWTWIFELRCKSKRGQELSKEEQALCARAFNEDRKKYSDTEIDVFNATKPFGAW